jgi:hypothetical protein
LTSGDRAFAVVLVLGQKRPGQADELAGDRDGRDLAAATRAHASTERAQRAGGAHRGVRGFAEHVARR